MELTVQEVAAVLGVSRQRIHQLVQAGALPMRRARVTRPEWSCARHVLLIDKAAVGRHQRRTRGPTRIGRR